MPGLNRKGPMGKGAMTGRRMGKCTNFGASIKTSTNDTVPDNQTRTGQGCGVGRGLGRGLGMGRKNRNRNGI